MPYCMADFQSIDFDTFQERPALHSICLNYTKDLNGRSKDNMHTRTQTHNL